MKIINTNLIKQPLNWAIILLMVLLSAVGGHLVLSYFGVEPKTSEQ